MIEKKFYYYLCKTADPIMPLPPNERTRFLFANSSEKTIEIQLIVKNARLTTRFMLSKTVFK